MPFFWESGYSSGFKGLSENSYAIFGGSSYNPHFFTAYPMSFAQFFQDNLVLFALLAVVILAIIVYEWKNRGQGGSQVSAHGVSRLVNDGALLIDTRSAADYKKGHIAGAKNHPAEHFAEQAEKLKSRYKTDKTVVLYCQNGLGANTQAKILRDAGFSDVYVLQGGLDSWMQDNLPLVK